MNLFLINHFNRITLEASQGGSRLWSSCMRAPPLPDHPLFTFLSRSPTPCCKNGNLTEKVRKKTLGPPGHLSTLCQTGQPSSFLGHRHSVFHIHESTHPLSFQPLPAPSLFWLSGQKGPPQFRASTQHLQQPRKASHALGVGSIVIRKHSL